MRTRHGCSRRWQEEGRDVDRSGSAISSIRPAATDNHEEGCMGASITREGRPDGLQNFVARRIAMTIASGELPSGTRLSPAKLAEELGVSHIPVREALVALEAVGQVKRIPRVGFFVAELSLDDIEDVYHWRQVLEDEAHRMAVPKLEKADLARMRQLNDCDSCCRGRSRHAGVRGVEPGLPFRRHSNEPEVPISCASSARCGMPLSDTRTRWRSSRFRGTCSRNSMTR